MKTKALALATLIFAASSSVCFAANDKKADSKCTNTECTHQKKCDKDCKKAINPFEGLNLTADQQAKLEALKQNCPAKAERQKADKQSKNDEQKANMKAQRAQGKRDFLAQVKGILTPEQYVQFLENSFVNAQNRHGNMDRNKGKMDGKKDRSSKGNGQNRPERGNKDNRSGK